MEYKTDKDIFNEVFDGAINTSHVILEVCPLESYQDMYITCDEIDMRDSLTCRELMPGFMSYATRKNLIELIRDVWEIAYNAGYYDGEKDATE